MKTFAWALAAAMLAGACAPVPPAPRILDVQTSDGVILKATVFASSSSRRGPAVLLLHQCDEQRKVWDSLGVKLARAGMTAMSIDFRGYGESGGIPHDKLTPAALAAQMSEQWPLDVDSAYKFLLRQPGVEQGQIGAAGGSCGVEHALQLAERWSAVRALALLAGPTNRQGRAFIAKEGALPLFLGASADDKYADFIAVQGWYAALSSNKQTRVIEYPDGGHAAAVFRSHPAFADTIAKWFSAVLLHKPYLLPATNGRAMSADVMLTLRDIDESEGAARVAEKLVLARKQNPRAQLFPEYFANQLGYEHLTANDYPGAVGIMKLNTVAYPDSPNAMDSLGDIYLASGDLTSASKTARQTLVLLDRDTVDTPERKQTIRDAAQTKIRQLSLKP